MIELNRIEERIYKEKQERYGISLVDMSFFLKVNFFDSLLNKLKEYDFIDVPFNSHITILRCKSIRTKVYITDEIGKLFDNVVNDLNNLTLYFKSITIDNDGVIRIRHGSNISSVLNVRYNGLDYSLTLNPWISIARITSSLYFYERFTLISNLLKQYNSLQYSYMPDRLEMILFQDILFNEITSIKSYELVRRSTDEAYGH